MLKQFKQQINYKVRIKCFHTLSIISTKIKHVITFIAAPVFSRYFAGKLSTLALSISNGLLFAKLWYIINPNKPAEKQSAFVPYR